MIDRYPLNFDEHYGTHVIEIDCNLPTENLFYLFERFNGAFRTRQFAFPTQGANHFPRRRVPLKEAQQIWSDVSGWNEYPEGEPHKGIAQLREWAPDDFKQLNLRNPYGLHLPELLGADQ